MLSTAAALTITRRRQSANAILGGIDACHASESSPFGVPIRHTVNGQIYATRKGAIRRGRGRSRATHIDDTSRLCKKALAVVLLGQGAGHEQRL